MLDTTASWVSGLIFGGSRNETPSTTIGSTATNRNSAIPRSNQPMDQAKLSAKLLYTSEDDWVVLDGSGQPVASNINGDRAVGGDTAALNTDSDRKAAPIGQTGTDPSSPDSQTKPSKRSRKEASRLKNAQLAKENPVDEGILLLAAMRDRELKLSKTRKLACR